MRWPAGKGRRRRRRRRDASACGFGGSGSATKRPPPAPSYSPPPLCACTPPRAQPAPRHTTAAAGARRRRPTLQNRRRPLPATHSRQAPPLSCTLSRPSGRRRSAGHQFRPPSPMRGAEASTAHTTAAAAPRCAIRVGPPPPRVAPPASFGLPTRHWGFLVFARRRPSWTIAVSGGGCAPPVFVNLVARGNIGHDARWPPRAVPQRGRLCATNSSSLRDVSTRNEKTLLITVSVQQQMSELSK